MSQRLKLIVAYDGAPFSGWQSQRNSNGIQDHLERAFRRITNESVRVHGAGRTDAGVHALGQCAHVDLPRKYLPSAQWTSALNALLPPTIRIMRTRYVPSSFHAQFSARGKVYRYRIWAAPILPPLERGRAWHVTGQFNVDLVQSAAKLFVGEHDFASFAANRGKREMNMTRILRSVTVRRTGRLITVNIEGDGFLYKMARMIVGALIQCGLGRISREEVASRLAGAKIPAGPLVAPGWGLFLMRVRY